MFVLDSNNFKKARLTLTLILLNLILFFSILTNNVLFYFLVQINIRILNDFEYWRLLSAIFIHGDPLHLFSNMFGLLFFGSFVETNLSKLKYLVIYFFSGFLGNFFSLILLPTTVISLGASGAIFGLIGASFIMIALQRDKTLLFLSAIYITLFLISSFSPNVNVYSHVFGLIGGILCGFLFYRREQPYSLN